jgi:hypothetical protein
LLTFFRRSQKISVLNDIKYEQLSQNDDTKHLSFPTHHKHRRDSRLSTLENFVGIDQLDIEKVIANVFTRAIEMTGPLDTSKLSIEHDLLTMDSLSSYVFQQMNSNSKMFDYSTQTMRDDSDEEDDGRSDDGHNANISSDDEEDDKDDGLETVKVCFDGMRIRDRIDPRLHDSYFKMKINGQQKFMHKQSACWLFKDKVMQLSKDLLSRLIQTSHRGKK